MDDMCLNVNVWGVPNLKIINMLSPSERCGWSWNGPSLEHVNVKPDNWSKASFKSLALEGYDRAWRVQIKRVLWFFDWGNKGTKLTRTLKFGGRYQYVQTCKILLPVFICGCSTTLDHGAPVWLWTANCWQLQQRSQWSTRLRRGRWRFTNRCDQPF